MVQYVMVIFKYQIYLPRRWCIYICMVYWAFKANEIYTHCFEANVQGTQSYTGESIDNNDDSSDDNN